MITKITFSYPNTTSFDLSDPDKRTLRIENAASEAEHLAQGMDARNGFIQFIRYNPDKVATTDQLQKQLKSYFGNFSVKNYTKKRRIYFVPFLYITEEDK